VTTGGVFKLELLTRRKGLMRFKNSFFPIRFAKQLSQSSQFEQPIKEFSHFL